MSNHFSAANLKFPGDDPRLDVTDLFVFASPDNPGKTVIIMDVNPFGIGKDFHPDAVYRINVDNNGDLLADVAFSFVFSPAKDGKQTATAYYATGSQAQQPEAAGEVLIESTPVGFDADAKPVQAGACRFFFGVRSDPFFADGEGAFHGFQFTGHDTFANTNVLSIALEVPEEMLGTNPQIGVWITTSLRRDGVLVQMDRGGHPSINPFINPDEEKDRYNSRHPVDDIANYTEPWMKILKERGYSTAEAEAALKTVLPDVLSYDRTKPSTYPNGRFLTDDIYDIRMAFLTHGRVTSDGVGPHTDYLAEFPFVGVPHPVAAATAFKGLS